MSTIRGLCLLLLLVCRSGFRLGGAYWTWRRQTAEGSARLVPGDRARAILHYARWLDRMRSISRL